MSTPEPTTRKPKKKERSPSYPAIDLGMAIRRAAQLRERESSHWAPVQAILEAWEYSPKSSGGLLTLAALKRYGLLEDRGSLGNREARLTEFARAILLDEREDSPERLERLRAAALTPPIHREIWDKYDGSLPSDTNLRYHLTVERGFSTGGAADFLRQFRRTIEFARLTPGSPIPNPQNGGNADLGSPAEEEPAPVERVTVPTIPIQRYSSPTMPVTAPPPIQFPVIGGGTVVLQSSVPLTEQAWEQMMLVLNTLKPAIVREWQQIHVGDLVDWESQGVLHGERLRVTAIEDGPDGGQYARVEGSETGIPLDQLALTGE